MCTKCSARCAGFSMKSRNDSTFRYMPLAVGLSFGFYLPVVLFNGSIPVVGILMIPKTLAYVWTVLMGYRVSKQQRMERLAVSYAGR